MLNRRPIVPQPAPAVAPLAKAPELTTVVPLFALPVPSAAATKEAPASRNEPDAVAHPRPAKRASAAQLFRQAGVLWRAGALDEAVALYRELQGQFASSREAKLPFLIAGRLLLMRGDNEGALRQFGLYLATAGPGAEEALAGSAQALERLGRQQDERLIWTTLLSQFPDSVQVLAHGSA